MIVAVRADELKAIVFDRVYSDAAGADIRTALETATTGTPATDRIIDAGKLATVRPVAPFLALRRGPIATVDQSIAAASFYWFIYDETDNTYLDSNGLLVLFAQAFNYKTNPLILGGARLGRVDLLIGEETTDSKLDNLLVTKLTLTVYC